MLERPNKLNSNRRWLGAFALALCAVGAISVSATPVQAEETKPPFGQKPEPTTLNLTQLRALVSSAYGPQPGSDEQIALDGKITAPFGLVLGYRAVYLGDDYPLATGKVPVELVRVNRLKLGDFYFGGLVAYITYNAPKFEVPETDGIIGTSILLFFGVYFDYSHYKMYLDGNSLYTKAAEEK